MFAEIRKICYNMNKKFSKRKDNYCKKCTERKGKWKSGQTSLKNLRCWHSSVCLSWHLFYFVWGCAGGAVTAGHWVAGSIWSAFSLALEDLPWQRGSFTGRWLCVRNGQKKKKENQKYLSTDIFRKGNRTIWTIEKKESSLP